MKGKERRGEERNAEERILMKEVKYLSMKRGVNIRHYGLFKRFYG